LPKISQAIANLDDSELGDNLLYYDYHVKHLLSLMKQGLGPENDAYMSAYRSFEGEVFENYAYEMLLRYAKEHDFIKQFIVKGPHKQRTKAQPNALSVNWKGQIVYRIKRNEIGEFDAMFFTDKELYFVEMTLVGSVTNLRKRMRKKRALLQTLFPHYDIKALLVLNEGVTGLSTLPDYATAWVTKPYSAAKVFEWLCQEKRPKRKPFKRIGGKQIVGTEALLQYPGLDPEQNPRQKRHHQYPVPLFKYGAALPQPLRQDLHRIHGARRIQRAFSDHQQSRRRPDLYRDRKRAHRDIHPQLFSVAQPQKPRTDYGKKRGAAAREEGSLRCHRDGNRLHQQRRQTRARPDVFPDRYDHPQTPEPALRRLTSADPP
jgi:hypothetical protein